MFGAALKEKGFRHRNEDYDEYEEDYDEYEEEASEHDGEDEHEIPKPTKEEQDFLKLREQLKDRIRKNLKKQNASSSGRLSQSQGKKTTSNSTFGSFFGPSQPVIASRVIEESRSIRETKHITANMSTSASKKRDSTSSAATILNHQHRQQPTVVKQIKNKAQTLKDMRDYSFLHSDDSELPTRKEQTVSRSVSAPKSDGRSAQTPLKNKLPMGRPAKLASVANGLKNPDSSKHNVQSKSLPAKEAPLNRQMPVSTESRKALSGIVGNGSSKPMGTNPLQRNAVGNSYRKPMGINTSQRNTVGNGSSKPMRTNPLQHNTVGNSSSKPMGTNPSQRNAVGNGSGKPTGNSTTQRKVPAPVASVNKPLNKVVNDPCLRKDLSAARPHSSVQKHYPEQKRPTQGVKNTMKQPMPPSKSQPSKQNLSRGSLDDRRKRKSAGRNLSDEEDVDYRSLIRGMFGYNPNKYAGMDEDDSDMEVGFDVIQKEERISSKIARKEDEEQLRLIEEEEERERQMRKKKKLKHS